VSLAAKQVILVSERFVKILMKNEYFQCSIVKICPASGALPPTPWLKQYLLLN